MKAYWQAEATYKEVLELDDRFTDALLDLAYIYEVTNRLETAEEAYLNILSFEAENIQARTRLGNLYMRQDRDREAIVRDALLRVDDLADALEDLSRSVTDDPEKARPRLIHWLHERDDLACLSFLARGNVADDVLSVALDRLDETACSHHSMWSFVTGFEDERLRAVASGDLDAWWGQLAEDT